MTEHKRNSYFTELKLGKILWHWEAPQEIFAGWIDDIYSREQPKSWFGKLVQVVKTRSLQLAFSSLAGCSFIMGAARLAVNAPLALFSERSRANVKIAFDDMIKDVLAVAAVAVGIYDPKRVSFYFVPKRKYSGNEVLYYPKNEEQANSIIEYSKKNGKNILLIKKDSEQRITPINAGDDQVVIDMRFEKNKDKIAINNQENSKITISGGELYKSASQVYYPLNEQELQQLVKTAKQQNKKIAIIGAGRSQGKQCLAGDNGIMIDMCHFNKVSIDATNKTVLAGAGASWFNLQEKANQKKLALKVMQASNVFSVGGSLGTNIHGWDHQSGTLINVVKSIRVVDNNGEIKTLTPDNDLFGKVIGGFGQFGVIVDAEIELTDNILLQEQDIYKKPEDFVEYFEKEVLPNKDVKMHLYRLSIDLNSPLSEGVAVNYKVTNDKEPKISNNFKQEGEHGTRFERIALNSARRSSGFLSWYWSYIKNSLLRNSEKTKPITVNEIMKPEINAMFNNSISQSEWLQEYFLPGDKLAVFLKQLSKVLTDNNVKLINATVRYVKQDSLSKMGYAADGDRYAVVLCFNQGLNPDEIIATKKWIRKAIDLTVANGGTFYLPYQEFATKEQFFQAYPQAKELYQDKKNSIYSNGLSDKYLNNSEENNYYKMICTDPKRREKFGKFFDIVFNQLEKQEFFNLMDDILTYCDNNEEIYSELKRRAGEIKPFKPLMILRQLSALDAIKTDISEQAAEILQNKPEFNGMIEIGFPGRFVGELREKLNLSGDITLVYKDDVGMVSKFLQSGGSHLFAEYKSLDDAEHEYAPLTEARGFKPESVDLITCVQGLHHVPEQELDQFVASIAKTLRKGGVFVLVDHNCKDEETKAMASLAHSVFNAIQEDLPLAQEKSELRNFQDINYWINLVENHGLKLITDKGELDKYVRKDKDGIDPTLNTMLCFVKPESIQEGIASWYKHKPATDDVGEKRISNIEDKELNLTNNN